MPCIRGNLSTLGCSRRNVLIVPRVAGVNKVSLFEASQTMRHPERNERRQILISSCNNSTERHDVFVL